MEVEMFISLFDWYLTHLPQSAILGIVVACTGIVLILWISHALDRRN